MIPERFASPEVPSNLVRPSQLLSVIARCGASSPEAWRLDPEVWHLRQLFPKYIDFVRYIVKLFANTSPVFREPFQTEGRLNILILDLLHSLDYGISSSVFVVLAQITFHQLQVVNLSPEARHHSFFASRPGSSERVW